MKLAIISLAVLPLAFAATRCAHDALSITAPAYLTEDGALNSWWGNQGSATFVFEPKAASATFWAKTLCPDSDSDSWRVNGRVWHIPQTSEYTWHEFGDPSDGPQDTVTTIELTVRESNCRIQAVYYGTEANLLLNGDKHYDCTNHNDNGYRCSYAMSLTSPVAHITDSPQDEDAINSPSGTLSGPGSLQVSFDYPSSFGAANLWFETKCSMDADSWYLNGDVWHVPQSTEYMWHNAGEFTPTGSSISFTLKPREGDCKIRAAYFGRDTPTTSGDELECDSTEYGICVSQAMSYEGNIAGLWQQAMEGTCRSSLSNPPAECYGSATFDFGHNRGSVWALTSCNGGDSDSWYVNDQVWHVPQSQLYEWHEIGNFDSRYITFKVREPNCRIQMVWRGYDSSLTTILHQQCTPLNFLDFQPDYPVQKPNHRNQLSFTKLYGTDGRELRAWWIENGVVESDVCKYGADNANGLAIDSSGGVYVADSQASTLFWVNSACNEKKVLIRSVDSLSNIGSVEILHTHGLLIVSTWASPAIYYVAVNANHEIDGVMNTYATNYHTHGLTECVDSYGNDGFLFVEQGNFLMFYDVVKKQRTTVLSPASGVVDIGDIEYHSCGLYFTANDNNQLWVCNHQEDGMNKASCTEPSWNCRRACDPLVDSSTCDNLMNPHGLAIDCNCNIFVGNKGNGNLVEYPEGSYLGSVIDTGNAYLNDLEVCGPATCSDAPPTGFSCGTAQAGQTATTGEAIVWVLSATEPILRPSVSCSVAGTPLNFQYTTPDELLMTHTVTYTVQASDPSGEVTCSFGAPIDGIGQAGTVSVSSAAECRVVIGSSSSPTPSPSVSPSPPPVHFLQVQMHFESGECSTDGCVNADPLDNVTIRMTAGVSKVDPNYDITTLADCSVAGGTPTQSGQDWFCFFYVEFQDLHAWNINEFELFRLTSNGPPPDWHVTPAIFAANTYPNTLATAQGGSQARVAAAVLCTGLPSASPLRWVWLRGSDLGPCYNDPTLGGFELCSAAGKENNNANYQDVNGNVMPVDAIFKDVFCPT